MLVPFSKKLRSGTHDHPTPRSLIRHMLAELIASRRWNWVTFETESMKHFVEVARENGDLIINVAYEFSEDYRTLFSRKGIAIPDGWTMTKFKMKRWLTGGCMLLTTSVHDQERVTEFVGCLFPALSGADPSYELGGAFQ